MLVNFSDLRGFRASGVIKLYPPRTQLAAPTKTFARIRAFHRFSQMFVNFSDLHGFRGSGVIKFYHPKGNLRPLQKPLLMNFIDLHGLSRSGVTKFHHPKSQHAAPIKKLIGSMFFIAFHRLSRIPLIFKDFVDLVSKSSSTPGATCCPI